MIHIIYKLFHKLTFCIYYLHTYLPAAAGTDHEGFPTLSVGRGNLAPKEWGLLLVFRVFFNNYIQNFITKKIKTLSRAG